MVAASYYLNLTKVLDNALRIIAYDKLYWCHSDDSRFRDHGLQIWVRALPDVEGAYAGAVL